MGKYAIDTTRITVICAEENGKQVIRVVDNGTDFKEIYPERVGMGTQQAETLARQIRGSFQRVPNEPKGTRCELDWKVRKFWW